MQCVLSDVPSTLSLTENHVLRRRARQGEETAKSHRLPPSHQESTTRVKVTEEAAPATGMGCEHFQIATRLFMPSNNTTGSRVYA